MEKMPAGPPKRRSVKPDAGKYPAEKSMGLRSSEEKATDGRRRALRPADKKTADNRRVTPGPKDNKTADNRRRRPGPKDEKATESRRRDQRSTDKKVTDEPVRLNKYIANSGVCARREADELIRNGYITVNGVKVTEMGHKVISSDTVEYKGKKLIPGKKVYILLNKPKGYVTTVRDPHADVTVLDLVKEATTERIYPVGRLDKSTTGVLLLTNDGDLAGKLTHPSYGARKVYHVFTDKEVTRHDMETIISGVTLEDGKVSADAISYPEPEDHTQVGLEIHSGQNRVVRRIFEKLGYRVRKLDRVSFAGLTKKNLQRGHWRHLTSKEVSMLKRGIYK